MCSPPLVHKNIKSSNILLDSELTPHLSDYGLANFHHVSFFVNINSKIYIVVSSLMSSFLKFSAHKSEPWSWIQCSRMHRSFSLHIKEWCLQLWCGDAGAANRSKALWQVQLLNIFLEYSLWCNGYNDSRIWKYYCFPLIFSERPKAEQSLVRWAKPQLKEMDTLEEMVDPSLCGLYVPESVSAFADIVSICVMV